MNIQDSWEKALKKTEIIRPRVQPLHTFDETRLKYVFLSQSAFNAGDTVVRRGEVMIEKPAIVFPYDFPQFIGFDFEKEFGLHEDFFTNFLLVRGIRFPSLKYNNTVSSLDVHGGPLCQAIKHYIDTLQREEDVHTGLLAGPEDTWQFSILIFICSQVMRSADNDIKKLLDDFKRKGNLS